MLSGSSSLKSRYDPALILSTALASIVGKAEDKTRGEALVAPDEPPDSHAVSGRCQSRGAPVEDESDPGVVKSGREDIVSTSDGETRGGTVNNHSTAPDPPRAPPPKPAPGLTEGS